MLGVRPDQVEDVVTSSEASARAALTLSRRGLFLGAGAVAAGTLFIETAPLVTAPFDYFELTHFNQMLKKLYPKDYLEQRSMYASQYNAILRGEVPVG